MDDLVERARAFGRSPQCTIEENDLLQAAFNYQADRIDALEAALDGIMTGGNHLALMIGSDHPPFTALPLDALEHYGAGGVYEIWCCWRSIMLARQALKGTDNAE